jgi:dipeptidase E
MRLGQAQTSLLFPGFHYICITIKIYNKRLHLIRTTPQSGEDIWVSQRPDQKLLGDKANNAIFIPYAAVTFSFDEYAEKVKARFEKSASGHHVKVFIVINPVEAIENADAIVVGGGNTWQLVKMLQEKGTDESDP